MRRTVLATGVAAVLISVLTMTAAFASPITGIHKKKSLSLANITIACGMIGYCSPVYLAQAKGYYAQQGLNVTFIGPIGAGSNYVAVLIAGTAQFSDVSATTTTSAAANAAPIRAIMSTESGSESELAISKSLPVAAKLTSHNALTNFEALKGANLTIGFPSATGDPYVDVTTLARLHGLSLEASGSDLHLNPLGSSTTMLAAYNTGKISVVGSTPPFSLLPNTMTIQLGKIPPIANRTADILSTTTQMIASHPDTVQAVVNAVTEASHFQASQPQKAVPLLAPMFNLSGNTDPGIQNFLFKYALQYMHKSPSFTRQQFGSLIEELNLTVPTPLTLTYKNYVDDTFVNKAIAKFNYHYPKG